LLAEGEEKSNVAAGPDLLEEIKHQNKMKALTTVGLNLEFWPGLMILFSIAFGPTFIALSITEVFTINSPSIDWINTGVIVVFLVFAAINFFSIRMLNHVYSSKKLGSFQEMAWSTSSGNRGYIFLISAMKVIYLCVTSSYCISFIATFLTGIVQAFIWHSKFQDCNQTTHTCPVSEFADESAVSEMNWTSYGIYAGFVLLIAAAAWNA